MIDDTAESRLKETLFVVEATSFEQHCLWQQFAENSPYRISQYGRLRWEQMDGWLITIGHIEDHPVCMTVSWAKINGHLVMFWDQCSRVTDSVMAEAWINEHFKGKWDNGNRLAQTDANNFHHCVHAIREAEESQKP